MLIESVTFAPFVFLGAVVVDIFVAGVHHSVYVIVTSEFLLVIVYVSLALFVRKRLKFAPRPIRRADAVAFLIFILAAAMLSRLYIVAFCVYAACSHPISCLAC